MQVPGLCHISREQPLQHQPRFREIAEAAVSEPPPAPSAGVFLRCREVYRHAMLSWLKWIGSGMGIPGALVIALNLPFSGWGFVLFLVSSVSWTVAGVIMRENSLALLNGVFTAVNLLGIYRWLIA